MDVANLSAGPALDRLIAERVMGWTEGKQFRIWNGNLIDRAGPLDGSHDDTGFRPSAEISHAWEVIARMNGLGYEAHLTQFSGAYWEVEFAIPERVRSGVGLGEPASLAICLAALSTIPATKG